MNRFLFLGVDLPLQRGVFLVESAILALKGLDLLIKGSPENQGDELFFLGRLFVLLLSVLVLQLGLLLMQFIKRLAFFFNLLLSGCHLLLQGFDLLPDLGDVLLDILGFMHRNVADSFFERLSPGGSKRVRRDLGLHTHLGLELCGEELRLALYMDRICLQAAEEDNSCRRVS